MEDKVLYKYIPKLDYIDENGFHHIEKWKETWVPFDGDRTRLFLRRTRKTSPDFDNSIYEDDTPRIYIDEQTGIKYEISKLLCVWIYNSDNKLNSFYETAYY
jgi:hypothetical protein